MNTKQKILTDDAKRFLEGNVASVDENFDGYDTLKDYVYPLRKYTLKDGTEVTEHVQISSHHYLYLNLLDGEGKSLDFSNWNLEEILERYND